MVNLRRVIFLGSVLAALGGGATTCYVTCHNQTSSQRIRTQRGRILHAAFVNHYVDPEHVACFEKMAGGTRAAHLDLAMRYTNFRELGSEFPFPLEEAEFMRGHGGALYLVLEPGSSHGPNDRTFPPGRIANGSFDEGLEAFAAQAREFGGPLLVSFRRPREGSYNERDIRAAYVHVVRTVRAAGADNVRFVWHADLTEGGIIGDYPGNDAVDWISINAYHSAGTDIDTLLRNLRAAISHLRSHGKPIIVEFGSSADPAAQAEFVRRAIDALADLNVGAILLNDVSQAEGSQWRSWTLSGEARTAYAESITAHNRLFLGNVLTENEELTDSSVPPENLDCSRVEGRFFTPPEGRRITKLQETITRAEAAYKTRGRVPLEYSSDQTLILARAYRELSGLTANTSLLTKSIEVIRNRFDNPIPNISFGTEQHPYVDRYFDLRLERAETLRRINNLAAIQESQSILEALNDEELLAAELPTTDPVQRPFSIGGYRSKAHLTLGQAYYSLNDFDSAEIHLQAVIDWSDELTTPFASSPQANATYQWSIGQDRDSTLYNGFLAKLIKASIQFYRPERDAQQVITTAVEVLSWSRVGDENGYLDLAFRSLIVAMNACASLHPDDPQAARALFNRSLPWAQINGYEDLKVALGIEDYDLTNPGGSRWDIILRGLLRTELIEADITQIINELRIYSEI